MTRFYSQFLTFDEFSNISNLFSVLPPDYFVDSLGRATQNPKSVKHKKLKKPRKES